MALKRPSNFRIGIMKLLITNYQLLTTRAKCGFTLIELLIVVTIIGILGSVGLTYYGTSQARARDASRQGDLLTLGQSLEIYYADFNRYPSTSGSWNDLPTALASLAPTYIKVLPTDPKGTSVYRYRDTASGQGYCLEAVFEIFDASSTCTVPLESGYSYGVGNP